MHTVEAKNVKSIRPHRDGRENQFGWVSLCVVQAN
jgi:hypothetical protein